MFSSLVLSQSIRLVDDAPASGEAIVVVDPSLAENRSVSLLRVEGGPVVLSLSPARARELALSNGSRVDDAGLAARLDRAGIALTDPDHLFYLTLDAQDAIRDEVSGGGTRQLKADDAAAFEEFTAAAPDDDLDEAFVELDHWLVFGSFVADTLVSAASMYPWNGTQLADLGVITLPEFRGRGLGRATVRAMSATALARGYEPQYRCQLDNSASIALARAAGFTLFGKWEVIDTSE